MKETIPTGWSLKKISDIGEVIGGGTPSTKEKSYYGGNVPWITPKDLSKHQYVYIERGKRNISQLGLKNSSARLMQKGTVLFSSRAPIGYLAIAKNEISTNQGFKSIICYKNIANNLFIYYCLKYHKDAIENIAAGSTFKEISGKALKNFKIPLPPLNEQNIIAEILFSIDSKIEVNQTMNLILEKIGQALFKQWFINLEFPDEQGRPYRTNGGEIENTKLGEVPNSWKIACINDIIEDPISGDWGNEIQEENFSKVVFCVRGADIPNISIGNDSKAPIRYIKPEKFEKCHLKSMDIVLEISGGSPTQSTGRAVLITENVLNRYKNKLICSNFCKVIRTKDEILSPYLYYLINYLYFKDFFFQFENGTTGIKNLDIKSLFKYHNILIPPKDILDNFNKQILIISNSIHNNGTQSELLSQIRDSLLPKLITGNLRVDGEITNDFYLK